MANYTIAQFEASVSKWVDQVEDGLDQIIKTMLKNVYRDLVLGSPVDTGRFRANWQVTANYIPMHALNEYDKSGGETIRAGNRDIESMRFMRGGAITKVYFSNMLIYANALEYGHSKQAPAGVLGIVAVRLRSYMSNAIREGRAKNGI